MLMIMSKYKFLLIMCLIYFYETLSGPGINKLLYLTMILLNSSFKNSVYSDIGLDEILSKILILIC